MIRARRRRRWTRRARIWNAIPAQLEYQKANYARDQKLFAAKIISQDQMDTDTASRDAATGTVAADKAAITNALLNLEFCRDSRAD